jgi:hypothetical protein
MPIRKELRPLYKTPQWFEARAKVRERAEDRCERCGARNGAYVVRDASRRGYTAITARDAAALKTRGERVALIQCGCAHRNNVPGDDRLSNLAWWCRGCHLKSDARHHKRSRAARKDRARPLLEASA